MEPKKEHLTVLKKYFGHKEFRPVQWKIIHSIIEDKRDNCVVMATGYGKSLCYQYPPVFCKGLGIVISPLISLMQDQVLSLKMRNIPACFMGSTQTEKSLVEVQLLSGHYRLMYITPEWVSSDYGQSILDKLNIQYINVTLIAIDEAHCVSQWGHDFRKSYRDLGKLRKIFPNVPVIAVTATATPQVRADISSSLKLRNPLQVCTSFDRPNLFFSASVKSLDLVSDLRNILARQNIENNSLGSTIIYCPTQKISEKVYCSLNVAGFKCLLYHAGLSQSVRARAHEEFMKDNIKIIIATIAFGMGIDKPDVRVVIHYGAPKDLESYYQEIGRAGRDGLPALCHTLYAQTDFTLNKNFITGFSGQFLNHKEEMCRLMECYLQTTGCRRKVILNHFSPNTKIEQRDPKECCDNCIKNGDEGNKADIDYNLTDDALLLLKAVEELSGRYGLMMNIAFLRGSNQKRLPERYHSSKLYGAGKEKTDPWWRLLGGLLLREYLLEETISNFGQGWNKNNFPLKVIKVSKKGKLFLENNGETAHLEPTPEMLKMIRLLPRKTKDGWVETNKQSQCEPILNPDPNFMRDVPLEDQLFDELLKFRAAMAEKLKCMPYMILESRSIQDLSMKRPKTIEELSLVEGINEAKIKNFGKECLELIAKVLESSSKVQPSSSKPICAKKFMKNFVFKQAGHTLSYDEAEAEPEKAPSEEKIMECLDNSGTAALDKDTFHTKSKEVTANNDLENSLIECDISYEDIIACVEQVEIQSLSISGNKPTDKLDDMVGLKRKRPGTVYDVKVSSNMKPYQNATTLEEMVQINKEKKKYIKKKIKL